MSATAMNKERDRKNVRTALGVGLIVLVSLAYFVYNVWPFR
jgi:hypothetical protein